MTFFGSYNSFAYPVASALIDALIAESEHNNAFYKAKGDASKCKTTARISELACTKLGQSFLDLAYSQARERNRDFQQRCDARKAKKKAA